MTHDSRGRKARTSHTAHNINTGRLLVKQLQTSMDRLERCKTVYIARRKIYKQNRNSPAPPFDKKQKSQKSEHANIKCYDSHRPTPPPLGSCGTVSISSCIEPAGSRPSSGSGCCNEIPDITEYGGKNNNNKTFVQRQKQFVWCDMMCTPYMHAEILKTKTTESGRECAPTFLL